MKERELRLLKQAFEWLGNFVLIMDFSGRIQYINQVFSRRTGYALQEVFLRSFWEVFVSMDERALSEAFYGSLDTHSFPFESLTQLLTKTGVQLELQCSHTVVEIGDSHYIVLSAVDVTAQRRVEETLRKSNDMLYALIYSSPLAVIALDSQGTITQWNPAARRVFGWEEKEAVGRNLFFLDIRTEYSLEHYSSEVLRGRSFQDLEIYGMRKDRKVIAVNVSLAPLRSSFGVVSGILAVCADISERKEMERQLASYLAAIEEKNAQLEVAYGRIEQDVQEARSIHNSFLPKVLPVVPGVEFGTIYKPAGLIGGDFYNVLVIGQTIVVYVVDVIGHGLHGALLNIFIRESINSFMESKGLKEGISPRELIDHVVKRYHKESFALDYLVCLLVAVLDLEEETLTCSNAGFQNLPFLVLPQKEATVLLCTGLPISHAIDPALLRYMELTVAYPPGSMFFCASDGLFEQYVEQQEEAEKKALQFLAENSTLEVSRMLEELLTSLDTQLGYAEPLDDITAVVVRYTKRPLEVVGVD